MKRLTKIAGDHVLYCGPDCAVKSVGSPPGMMDEGDINRVLERLAAYEDLGMEPEEIKSILQPRTPLTKEELMEMDGEPIEFVHFGRAGVGIVNGKCGEICALNIHGLRFDNLGEIWAAYRYTGPKGGAAYA